MTEPDMNNIEDKRNFVQEVPKANQAELTQNKKPLKYLFVGIVFAIVLVFLGAILWFYQNNNEDLSLVPSQETKVVIGEYEEEVLDVHSLSLMVPTNWTVTEINYEEPNLDHHQPCADYLIQDDRNTIELELDIVCGFADGGADIWPENSTIISDISEGSYLIRHQIPDGIFQYGQGYENTGSDVGRTSNIMLSAGEDGLLDNSGDITLFSASVSLTGSNIDKEELLSVSDRIILSIKHQARYSDKFVDETEINESEMSSYSSDELRISFKYPSSWKVEEETSNPDIKWKPEHNIRINNILFLQSYHDRVNSNDYYGQEPERIKKQNVHGPIVVDGKEYELKKVYWEDGAENQGSEQSTYFVDIPNKLSIGFSYQVFKEFDDEGNVISTEYALNGDTISDSEFNQLIESIYDIVSTIKFEK